MINYSPLSFVMYLISVYIRAFVTEWLRRLALKLLAPLRWGSNAMRGSCSVTNGRLLVHSHEQFVPPAVETDRHI